VLIADEPTTALDVTIQAQILDLIAELKDKLGTAVILITHDLGVVAETAQRVVVLYAGRKVEEAPVEALFDSPLHPYTQGLMAAIPKLAQGARRLNEIPGSVQHAAAGCSFAARCPRASEQCRAESPALTEPRPGHFVACWHA
jgi:peptide/nickel transport system ATP-binding protein